MLALATKEQIVTDQLEEFLPSKINDQSYTVYYQDAITGPQIIIRFPNNYGASIIRFDGLFDSPFLNPFKGKGKRIQLAIIKFYGPSDYDWEICYDTPITDDVIDYLNKERCIEILNDIGNLPPKGEHHGLS